MSSSWEPCLLNYFPWSKQGMHVTLTWQYNPLHHCSCLKGSWWKEHQTTKPLVMSNQVTVLTKVTTLTRNNLVIRKGRSKKVKFQNSSSALSTAVELFEKLVNNDPTTQLMSFFKEENQRAHEHELKLMELFMTQRQPAASYSAGSSSVMSPERGLSPFAGPSYSAGSSSMNSQERNPSSFAYTAQGLLYEEPRQCQFSESEGKRYHQLYNVEQCYSVDF